MAADDADVGVELGFVLGSALLVALEHDVRRGADEAAKEGADDRARGASNGSDGSPSSSAREDLGNCLGGAAGVVGMHLAPLSLDELAVDGLQHGLGVQVSPAVPVRALIHARMHCNSGARSGVGPQEGASGLARSLLSRRGWT